MKCVKKINYETEAVLFWPGVIQESVFRAAGLYMSYFCCRGQWSEAGASKGTPGDAKCVTEILGEGDKNKDVRGVKFTFVF